MACWPRLPLAGWQTERESLRVRLSSQLRRRKCPGTPDRFVVSAPQDYEV